ncbi:MAG: hypothetical protein ACJAVO_001109 [Parvibaculaceae bacterium]|mgnify:CR=1 FL=1|jgi:hypothetical protein
MRFFNSVFVLFILAPVGFMYAYQEGWISGEAIDAWIPDAPFVQAELRERIPPAQMNSIITTALENDAYSDAIMYADIANYADIPLTQATQDLLAAESTLLAQVGRTTGSFFEGFIYGEGSDTAGFVGAISSDLTVIGDVRDIGREGTKLVQGEEYSSFVLGLSVVGLAATTATVATGGGALPARVGVSLMKVAKKAGTLTKKFSKTMGRLVKEAVNFPALRRTLTKIDLSDISATRRAVDDYAKSVSTGKLDPIFKNITYLESTTNPSEAVRMMKYVDTPQDLARLGKMTGKLGTKTRGIIEVTGKTSLRAFKTVKNLFLWALDWVLWAGGVVALWLGRMGFKGIARKVRA